MVETWRLAAVAAVDTLLRNPAVYNPGFWQEVERQLKEVSGRGETNGRREALKAMGVLALGVLVAACAKATGVELPAATATQKPESPTAQPRKTVAPSQARELSKTSEPSSTLQSTEVPTPNRPDFKAGAGGRYTPEQQKLIESGTFGGQEQLLSDFYVYWMKAKTRPVFPMQPGQSLNFEYVFGVENPNEACVAIPAVGYTGTDLLAGPYYKGEPIKAAPTKYVEAEIETGQGPLLLTKTGTTGNGEAFNLGCKDGKWVRRDTQGLVVETINPEGQWMARPTETLEPLVLNTNPENIEAYTRITMEDITSGRVAAANRALAKPFPSEATVGSLAIQTNLMKNYGYAYVDMGRIPEYITNSETRPNRWLSFNLVELEGNDYITAGVQILNKDRTYATLCALLGKRDYVLSVAGGKVWERYKKMFEENNAAVSVASGFADDCNTVYPGLEGVCRLYQDGRQGELIKQWVDTGIIPGELERLLVWADFSEW